MRDEERLNAAIAKSEQEVCQLKQQLQNNRAAAGRSSAVDAEPACDEPQQPPEEEQEDPTSAFLDWSQLQAELDGELEEQLRARMATADAVTAELEQHLALMARVSADRRRVGLDTTGLLDTIAQRQLEQRRLHSAIRRELNRVLRTIHNEDGFITIQQLLDRLFTRLQTEPGAPYVPVSRDIFPEHLSMLERAGIVRFQSHASERRVRMVDHSANLELERIRPAQEPDQEMADGGAETTSPSPSPSD